MLAILTADVDVDLSADVGRRVGIGVQKFQEHSSEELLCHLTTSGENSVTVSHPTILVALICLTSSHVLHLFSAGVDFCV